MALKRYRDRKGLTVTEAADLFGVPEGSLHDMEQRARSPRTHSASVAAHIILELLDERSAI